MLSSFQSSGLLDNPIVSNEKKDFISKASISRKEARKTDAIGKDYPDIKQLVCLANLESLNAHLISEKNSQEQRVKKLNKVAIGQMKILLTNTNLKRLEEK